MNVCKTVITNWPFDLIEIITRKEKQQAIHSVGIKESTFQTRSAGLMQPTHTQRNSRLGYNGTTQHT
jgi:hypothetical protein